MTIAALPTAVTESDTMTGPRTTVLCGAVDPGGVTSADTTAGALLRAVETDVTRPRLLGGSDVDDTLLNACPDRVAPRVRSSSAFKVFARYVASCMLA